MKKNYFVGFLVMLVVGLASSPLFGAVRALPPMPEMTPPEVIKSLPWEDTSLTTDWSGEKEPKGWNAMSVNLTGGADFFVYPSGWKFDQEKGHTIVKMDKYVVNALMLPVLEIPEGVKVVKITFDLYADQVGAPFIVFNSDGLEQRYDGDVFMSKVIGGDFKEFASVSATDPTSVEYLVEMNNITSGVVNVVMMVMDLEMKGITYGIKNLTVVDADKTTSITESEALPTFVTTGVRSVSVANIPQGATVEIYNVTGGKVGEYKAADSVLNVSLESGLYLVKVISQDVSKVMKALVK